MDEVYNKLLNSFVESIPEELYVVKEVTFNSDVLNCEHCIFFQNERNMFSVWRYPAPDNDLPKYIRDAMKFFRRNGLEPQSVLIPFNVMALYQARTPLYTEDLPRPTLEYVCKEFGLVCSIMIPDRLKDKVKGV